MFTVAAAFILGFMYFLVADLRRAQRGLSSKNIFRSYSLDRLSFFLINLIFSFLKIEDGLGINLIF